MYLRYLSGCLFLGFLLTLTSLSTALKCPLGKNCDGKPSRLEESRTEVSKSSVNKKRNDVRNELFKDGTRSQSKARLRLPQKIGTQSEFHRNTNPKYSFHYNTNPTNPITDKKVKKKSSPKYQTPIFSARTGGKRPLFRANALSKKYQQVSPVSKTKKIIDDTFQIESQVGVVDKESNDLGVPLGIATTGINTQLSRKYETNSKRSPATTQFNAKTIQNNGKIYTKHGKNKLANMNKNMHDIEVSLDGQIRLNSQAILSNVGNQYKVNVEKPNVEDSKQTSFNKNNIIKKFTDINKILQSVHSTSNIVSTLSRQPKFLESSQIEKHEKTFTRGITNNELPKSLTDVINKDRIKDTSSFSTSTPVTIYEAQKALGQTQFSEGNTNKATKTEVLNGKKIRKMKIPDIAEFVTSTSQSPTDEAKIALGLVQKLEEGNITKEKEISIHSTTVTTKKEDSNTSESKTSKSNPVYKVPNSSYLVQTSKQSTNKDTKIFKLPRVKNNFSLNKIKVSNVKTTIGKTTQSDPAVYEAPVALGLVQESLPNKATEAKVIIPHSAKEHIPPPVRPTSKFDTPVHEVPKTSGLVLELEQSIAKETKDTKIPFVKDVKIIQIPNKIKESNDTTIIRTTTKSNSAIYEAPIALGLVQESLLNIAIEANETETPSIGENSTISNKVEISDSLPSVESTIKINSTDYKPPGLARVEVDRKIYSNKNSDITTVIPNPTESDTYTSRNMSAIDVTSSTLNTSTFITTTVTEKVVDSTNIPPLVTPFIKLAVTVTPSPNTSSNSSNTTSFEAPTALGLVMPETKDSMEVVFPTHMVASLQNMPISHMIDKPRHSMDLLGSVFTSVMNDLSQNQMLVKSDIKPNEKTSPTTDTTGITTMKNVNIEATINMMPPPVVPSSNVQYDNNKSPTYLGLVLSESTTASRVENIVTLPPTKVSDSENRSQKMKARNLDSPVTPFSYIVPEVSQKKNKMDLARLQVNMHIQDRPIIPSSSILPSVKTTESSATVSFQDIFIEKYKNPPSLTTVVKEETQPVTKLSPNTVVGTSSTNNIHSKNAGFASRNNTFSVSNAAKNRKPKKQNREILNIDSEMSVIEHKSVVISKIPRNKVKHLQDITYNIGELTIRPKIVRTVAEENLTIPVDLTVPDDHPEIILVAVIPNKLRNAHYSVTLNNDLTSPAESTLSNINQGPDQLPTGNYEGHRSDNNKMGGDFASNNFKNYIAESQNKANSMSSSSYKKVEVGVQNVNFSVSNLEKKTDLTSTIGVQDLSTKINVFRPERLVTSPATVEGEFIKPFLPTQKVMVDNTLPLTLEKSEVRTDQVSQKMTNLSNNVLNSNSIENGKTYHNHITAPEPFQTTIAPVVSGSQMMGEMELEGKDFIDAAQMMPFGNTYEKKTSSNPLGGIFSAVMNMKLTSSNVTYQNEGLTDKKILEGTNYNIGGVKVRPSVLRTYKKQNLTIPVNFIISGDRPEVILLAVITDPVKNTHPKHEMSSTTKVKSFIERGNVTSPEQITVMINDIVPNVTISATADYQVPHVNTGMAVPDPKPSILNNLPQNESISSVIDGQSSLTFVDVNIPGSESKTIAEIEQLNTDITTSQQMKDAINTQISLNIDVQSPNDKIISSQVSNTNNKIVLEIASPSDRKVPSTSVNMGVTIPEKSNETKNNILLQNSTSSNTEVKVSQINADVTFLNKEAGIEKGTTVSVAYNKLNVPDQPTHVDVSPHSFLTAVNGSELNTSEAQISADVEKINKMSNILITNLPIASPAPVQEYVNIASGFKGNLDISAVQNLMSSDAKGASDPALFNNAISKLKSSQASIKEDASLPGTILDSLTLSKPSFKLSGDLESSNFLTLWSVKNPTLQEATTITRPVDEQNTHVRPSIDLTILEPNPAQSINTDKKSRLGIRNVSKDHQTEGTYLSYEISTSNYAKTTGEVNVDTFGEITTSGSKTNQQTVVYRPSAVYSDGSQSAPIIEQGTRMSVPAPTVNIEKQAAETNLGSIDSTPTANQEDVLTKSALKALCQQFTSSHVDYVSYAPYPGHCSKMIQCMDTGVAIEPVVRYCPLGLFWDQPLLMCRNPKDVPCFADKCLTGIYNHTGHWGCRSYYKCSDAASMPKCCAEGHRYVENLGGSGKCVEDPTCVDNCETLQSTVKMMSKNVRGCHTLPDKENKDMYWEVTHGTLQMRACPEGTVYSKSRCRCALHAFYLTHGRHHNGCRPEFSLDFDSGRIRDISHGGLSFDHRHIAPVNGYGIFRSSSRVLIWGFINRDLGGTFAISFRIMPEKGGCMQGPESIVSNCGPHGEPSVDIICHKKQIQFTTRTQGYPKAVIIAVNFQEDRWLQVTYQYHNNRVTGQVDDRQYHKVMGGRLEQRNNPMVIGKCPKVTGFRGKIDNVEIYTTCIPGKHV